MPHAASPSVVPRSLVGRLPVLVALLPFLAACGDATASGGVEIVDSAGIPVVHNPPGGLWGPDDAWTVEEELRIGGMEGDLDLQFGQVMGVDVGTAGRIYVADGQAREIRVFGPDGVHERTFGQAGSGPGELGAALQGPFVADGEIRVVDLQNQRVSRFSPTGEPLGSFRLDFTAGVPLRWDETGSDVLVAQFRRMAFTDTAASEPAGDPVVILARDGTVQDTIAVLPPGESFQVQGGEARMRLFEPEPMWDVGEDGTLVSGRNHEFRVEVRSPGGELQRVVTLPLERRPVTERDQQVFRDALVEAASDQGVPPAALEAVFGRMSFAEFYPVFATLLVGPDGTLWAQRFRTGDDLAGAEGDFDPQDMGSNQWDVFDEEGRYLGVVEFPGRFQPLRVIGDRFYGVGRDELDVQALVVYRLLR